MIKAVIFDFDEVIIRSRENHLKAFLLTLKKFGYRIDKREIDENGSDISHIINELREIDGVGDVTVNMLSLEKLL